MPLLFFSFAFTFAKTNSLETNVPAFLGPTLYEQELTFQVAL